MLLERTEQYRRLADRRDGRSVVGQAGSLDIPQPFGDVPINVAAANVVPGGTTKRRIRATWFKSIRHDPTVRRLR